LSFGKDGRSECRGCRSRRRALVGAAGGAIEEALRPRYRHQNTERVPQRFSVCAPSPFVFFVFFVLFRQERDTDLNGAACRVYGTANAESDWDYIIVTNQHTTNCFVKGKTATTKKKLHSHACTPAAARVLSVWCVLCVVCVHLVR
jgi:hypothetical protein